MLTPHDLRLDRFSASEEQAFEAIKAGVDALPPGVKMFLNSCESFRSVCAPETTSHPDFTTAEFYAPDLGTGNLELLSRFYEKYPDYVEKTFLSVKVGTTSLPSCYVYMILIDRYFTGRHQAESPRPGFFVSAASFARPPGHT